MPSCAAGVRLLSFLGSKRFLWRVSPKRNTATPKRGFWIRTWKARSFWVRNGSMVRSCSVFLKHWPIPGMPVPHGSRWTSSQPSFHCAPTVRTTPWTVWHASPGMCSPAWESRKASWVSWMILDDWWEVGPQTSLGYLRTSGFQLHILEIIQPNDPLNIIELPFGLMALRLGAQGLWCFLKVAPPPTRLQPTNWARNARIMDPCPGTALIPLLLLGCKAGFISKWWSILWDPPKTQHRLGNWSQLSMTVRIGDFPNFSAQTPSQIDDPELIMELFQYWLIYPFKFFIIFYYNPTIIHYLSVIPPFLHKVISCNQWFHG